MTAALLCPGPSLAWLDALPPCDTAVGVNRAVCRFPCAVWAALDYTTIRDWQLDVVGAPALLTRRQTWADIGRRCPRFTDARLVEDYACPVSGWAEKTATAALVMLATVGATAIAVYGADWTDAPDFDGFTQKGSERGETRWLRERAVWAELAAWLAGEGVTLRRL